MVGSIARVEVRVVAPSVRVGGTVVVPDIWGEMVLVVVALLSMMAREVAEDI